jgi:hypothetical protein
MSTQRILEARSPHKRNKTDLEARIAPVDHSTSHVLSALKRHEAGVTSAQNFSVWFLLKSKELENLWIGGEIWLDS